MLVGGVFPADDDRFGAVIRTQGALCRLGRRARHGQFRAARHRAGEVPAAATSYIHNPNVTLMRTTREENRGDGRWIGERLNRMEGPVRFLLPEGGVSLLDAPGKPFHDPEADNGAVRSHRRDFPPDRPPPADPGVGANINDAGIRRRRSSAPSEEIAPRLNGDDLSAALRERTTGREIPGHEAPARPIIGGGAGTGLSAKCEEAGGIDLIVIYNSGRYRMAGRGSLAGPDGLWQCQRHRHGDGARGAAGRPRRRRCSPASTAPIPSASSTSSSTI